jgi:hypothetical protein
MSDCKRTEKGSAPLNSPPKQEGLGEVSEGLGEVSKSAPLNSPPSEGLGEVSGRRVPKVSFKEWCAAFSLFTAFLLSGINMFLPPFGEISDSVLWYTAQAFFFAGAALGIDTMIDRKLRGDR